MRAWRYSGDPIEQFEQDDLAYRKKHVNGVTLGYVLWVCHVRGQAVVYRETNIAKMPNQIANFGERINSFEEACAVFPQLQHLGVLCYGTPNHPI